MEYRIIKRNNKSVGIISYKDAAGNRSQKWITAGQYETDQQLKRRIMDWMDDYEDNDISNSSTITLGAFIKQWIETRDKIAITTRDEYAGFINKHIVPNLGNVKLSKLKTIDIDKLYKKLANSTYKKGKEEYKYSQNTIRQVHAILHKCLNYAKHNKIIKDNPADYCENKPKHKRYDGSVYTEEQFIALLKAVSGTVDEICVILAGCLGMRRGEMLGLKWEDVDLKNKVIHIQRAKVKTASYGILEKEPKNEKSIRFITINQKTVDVLRRWRKKNTDTVYVVNEFNPNTYSGHFKLILEKNGLPHTRFHDLRHFAATFMLKEGISDKVASQRLGHSTTVTTRDIYQHVFKEMDREAADKLDKLMG